MISKRQKIAGKWTLMYLILLVFAFVTVFPFLWMLLTTFKSSRAVFAIPPTWIPDKLFKPGMWDNYITVFTKHNFIRYTFNSVFVSFMAAAGQVITCSLAGFAFARMEFRGKNFFFGALLATSMVPVEVSIIPEFLMMIRLGWLNTYLPLIVPSFLTGSYGTFMLREANYKLVYFVGMEPELFDLDADPDETRNLAASPDHADVLARLTARLREICDPEEVDRRARADQAATIAKHGGREELLKRGDFGYSPAPGQKPEFSA